MASVREIVLDQLRAHGITLGGRVEIDLQHQLRPHHFSHAIMHPAQERAQRFLAAMLARAGSEYDLVVEEGVDQCVVVVRIEAGLIRGMVLCSPTPDVIRGCA